jgi:tetratricopeptide (TPR) repeat protein
VAEQTEGQQTVADETEAGIDPVAVSLALDGASRGEADAFLKTQRGLIADQRHHLNQQFEHVLRQLRLKVWEQRLGVLLRLATAFTGLAIAAGTAFMIWDASQSSGLLIEPFAVPPDLAARGLTGEVVAAKLLDQLSQMQAETNSARAAQSYTNDWGRSGLKLDIPETGISFTELDDFLREKLGHDTHITGEIVRTASGVSLTARAGGAGAETATGSDADLDALVQKSAEAIYRLTQPFRYGMYLASHGRVVEAIAVFQTVAKTGSRQDRAWAYPYWGLLVGEEDGVAAELPLLQKALNQEPDNLQAYLVAGTAHDRTGLPEQALRDWQQMSRLLSNDRLGMYSAAAASRLKPEAQAQFDLETGDFHDAA